MKLFICADMEGATGVTHREQLMAEGGEHYRSACRLLTGDINAVIDGATRGGVTEVLVSEGHAQMRNVVIELLHPAARVVRGPATWENKPYCQIQGLDESYDLAAFVGFHTRAGTPRGLLSHTWAGAVVHEITVNGQVYGETAINAAICGDFGVPVALVTGGDDLAREAKDVLPEVEAVVVKQVYGNNIAACWGPLATQHMLRDAMNRAVTRHKAGRYTPLRVPGPVTAELETHRREMIDKMSLVTGIERVGERRIRAVAPDARTALSTLWRCVVENFRDPAGWLQ